MLTLSGRIELKTECLGGWAARRGRQLGKCCRGGGLQRGECGHVGGGEVWGGSGQLKLSVRAGASAFAREDKCAFLINDDFGSGVRRVRFRRIPHHPGRRLSSSFPPGSSDYTGCSLIPLYWDAPRSPNSCSTLHLGSSGRHGTPVASHLLPCLLSLPRPACRVTAGAPPRPSPCTR